MSKLKSSDSVSSIKFLLAVILALPLLVNAQTAAPVSSPSPATIPEATASPTPAANSVDSPWPLPSLNYYITRLPKPPKPQSFRDRLDMQDVIARQGQMTPAQLQHAQWSYTFTVFNFSEVLGPKFTPENYPKTDAFFKQVTDEANVVITGLKNNYQRLRPFQAYPSQIRLYVRNEPGFGYPSGHTTRSRLFAYILAYLDPSHRRPLLDAAEQVGVDRMFAGEHYQTDLEAGRKLGKLIFYSLMKDPSFRQALVDLSAAEWSRSKPTN
ncbi:MAG: phosphatase PAP2 family protein [Chthoniobacterales bacterium]